MESTAFIIVFSIAVIGVSAVLFSGWLILSIFRGVARAFWAFTGLSPRRRAEDRDIVCPRSRCHVTNPSTARFCRRCGIELPVRRVRAAPAPSPAPRSASV
jgi:uncharacterized paraquat-inducible protein A